MPIVPCAAATNPAFLLSPALWNSQRHTASANLSYVSIIERLGPWPARACWVVLAVVAQSPVADALDGRSRAVQVVTIAGLATAWTAGLVALLIPRTTSLTVVRLIVPAGLAVVGAAAALGTESNWVDVIAATTAGLAISAVLAPWFTQTWVDGSSYGPEVRLPLQTPPLLAAVLVPLTLASVWAGVTVGPLLLASGQWVAGIVASAVGAALAFAGVRSIHQLSRRWVVMVPAGMVLHDPLTLPEAHMVPRKMIISLHPAAAGTDAFDLTAGASGLALQIDFDEPLDLLVRAKGRSTETLARSAVMFTPARPRQLLDCARDNRINVG